MLLVTEKELCTWLITAATVIVTASVGDLVRQDKLSHLVVGAKSIFVNQEIVSLKCGYFQRSCHNCVFGSNDETEKFEFLKSRL